MWWKYCRYIFKESLYLRDKYWSHYRCSEMKSWMCFTVIQGRYIDDTRLDTIDIIETWWGDDSLYLNFFFLNKKLFQLKVELPCSPTPGHISRGKHICNNTYIPIFIAALFTIAKTWQQPKCPSTEEWIKKMWYIYKMEYYPALKRIK